MCISRHGVKDHKTYTWDEVKKHTCPDNKWIVIDGNVYDISRWAKKHPGGARIISHFAGDDATVNKGIIQLQDRTVNTMNGICSIDKINFLY